MAYNDGIKTGPIAFVGLMSVLLLFIGVLFLQVVFFGETESMLAADQAQQGQPSELADLRAKQLTRLTTQEVVDRDRGVARIGISRAMELVTAELAGGKKPSEVQGPPLPAAPPAAPAPAASGAPANPSASAQPQPAPAVEVPASSAPPAPAPAPPAETTPIEEKK